MFLVVIVPVFVIRSLPIVTIISASKITILLVILIPVLVPHRLVIIVKTTFLNILFFVVILSFITVIRTAFWHRVLINLSLCLLHLDRPVVKRLLAIHDLYCMQSFLALGIQYVSKAPGDFGLVVPNQIDSDNRTKSRENLPESVLICTPGNASYVNIAIYP